MLSQEYLNECLVYLDSGILVWKERPRYHFNKAVSRDRWNKAHAGLDAGTLQSWRLLISVNGKAYGANHIVWALHHNQPSFFVGFINGIQADFRISNLSDNKARCNPIIRIMPSNSLSFLPEDGVWVVRMGYIPIRYHTTEEQAKQTYNYLKDRLE